MGSAQESKVTNKTGWQRTQSPEDVARYYREGWWRDRTYLDDILDKIKAHPDKPAIVAYTADHGLPQTLTYGQLGALVNRAAGALIDLGVERGDVVAIQLPTGWQFPIIALATMRAGAIPNPFPVTYRERELAFMLRHAQSKVLVITKEFNRFDHAGLGLKLQKDIPTLRHVVSANGSGPGLVDFEKYFLDHPWELADGFEEKLERRRPGPDDPASIIFTSGTTGVAKGTVHTFNTLYCCTGHIEAARLTGDDVCFIASTMGHMLGFLWGMLTPLALGQKVVYQEPWDTKRFLHQAAAEHVTWTFTSTPFAVDILEEHSKTKLPLRDLRVYVCGGTKAPPQLVIQTKEQLGVDMLGMWGASEFGQCSIHNVGSPLDILANSDGIPRKHTKIRVVDDDDNPVGPYQEGRLQVKGPNQFIGYLYQPELTSAAFTADGWFDTGDMGRMTEDGGVLFLSRRKDIIVRGGQNVPVLEIELELLKHPKVKDVAVVAVPDPRLGERGCAVVVPREIPPTLDDLKQHLEAVGMSKHFWPERLEIVSEMPKTPSGKIQKFVLRERLAAGLPATG